MKICKVKGCGKKHYARGKCRNCYMNWWYHNTPKGKEAMKLISKIKKEQWVSFRFFRKTISIYTNGVTEEIKPLIPKIKNDVLNDCIKNPRKYLDDEDETKT